MTRCRLSGNQTGRPPSFVAAGGGSCATRRTCPVSMSTTKTLVGPNNPQLEYASRRLSRDQAGRPEPLLSRLTSVRSRPPSSSLTLSVTPSPTDGAPARYATLLPFGDGTAVSALSSIFCGCPPSTPIRQMLEPLSTRV